MIRCYAYTLIKCVCEGTNTNLTMTQNSKQNLQLLLLSLQNKTSALQLNCNPALSFIYYTTNAAHKTYTITINRRVPMHHIKTYTV